MALRIPPLVIVAAAVSVLAACGGRDAETTGSRAASSASTRVRPIDRTLFVNTGREQVLYTLRGVHYGAVGRFLVSCRPGGVAKTLYVLTSRSTDAVVAVDGRGTSRAAKLRPEGHLLGSSKRSGIEQWIVLAGGKPESIRLDASLLVRPEHSLGCEFTIRGSAEIAPH
jgi:hypothetical protein